MLAFPLAWRFLSGAAEPYAAEHGAHVEKAPVC
jgi:hypothetical protein